MTILFAITMFLASVFALAMLVYVIRHQRLFRTLFGLFCLSVAIWSLGAGFEMLATSLAQKIFWAKVQYIGIVTLSPVWFIFVCRYTDTWKNLKAISWLFALPILTLILIWSNEYHHWIWHSITLSKESSIPLYTYGFWFSYIHTPYSYLLLGLTFISLGRSFSEAQKTQHSQLYILSTALILPIVCNVVYLFKLYPLDLTPLGFSLSCALLGFGLLRYGLTKQLPIAYRSVFQHMQDAVIVLDKDFSILEFNPAARNLFYFNPTHIQKNLTDLHPDLLSIKNQLLQHRIVSYTHQDKYLELTLSNIQRDQNLQGYLLSIQDITEKETLYKTVSDSEQRLKRLANNMSDLICLHELDGMFLDLTPSSQSLLGYDPQTLVGTSPFELIHPEDIPFVQKQLKQLAESDSIKHFSYRIRQRLGEYIWLETQATRIQEGSLSRVVTSSRDITERKQMQEQMLEGALLYDALTNLPNRVLFMDRLQQALRRLERSRHHFAVLFLDLDRFKVINDSLGHHAGDALLIEVAKRLQSCVRSQDTVARLGGDEFAVLLENIHETEVKLLAERILKVLGSPYYIEGHEVFSSLSIGISLSQDVAEPEQLLRYADLAMYEAKAQGKARYIIFDQHIHTSMLEAVELEVDLRNAIQQKEFKVYYQPIVDMTAGEVTGFEALVRWQHPKKGLIPPLSFIPIAEDMGLIVQIDQWVLSEACKQLACWKNASLRPLTMSVNLSTRNFLCSDLPQQLAAIIKENGISPQQLKLEITESVLLDNIRGQHPGC